MFTGLHKHSEVMPMIFWNVLWRQTNKYVIEFKFDHIFVCLSPQYIPKNHWHYFTMFMQACEHSGKQVIVHEKKYENEFRYAEVKKVLKKTTNENKRS